MDFEIAALLTDAAKSDLASYLIVVAVVWKTMLKKVGTHFKGMEDAVKKLTAEVGLIREDLNAAMKQTGSRLDAVESSMLQLRGRVTVLEKPKEGMNGRNQGN